MYKIVCPDCGYQLSAEIVRGECPKCNGIANIVYDLEWVPHTGERSMWRYKQLLPIASPENVISLGEGMTPLLRSRLFRDAKVYLKDETRNPTGSMKDRAMSVAFSRAKELGITNVITATAGGLGIAASAYASRAGIECTILIPPGISMERIMSMQIYGAKVIEINGTIEDCLDIITKLVAEKGYVDTTTYKRANLFQAEGPKTISFEIYEQLGQAPDYVVAPIGGGGTLGAMWRGFKELQKLGLIDKIPRMFGVQNANFNGIEIAVQQGITTEEELKSLNIDMTIPTVTGAIKHSYVPDGLEVLSVFRNSNGGVLTVSDQEAMQAQISCSHTEGLFIEPSSSCVIAGLNKLIENKLVTNDETGVLVLTGSGYREIGITTEYHYKSVSKMSIEDCVKHLS